MDAPRTYMSAALAQTSVCLSLVQLGRGSIPGDEENLIMVILNLGARRGEDVEIPIARPRVRKSGTLCHCSVTLLLPLLTTSV